MAEKQANPATPCVCPAPGFCHRHGIDKPQRLWELCRSRMDYFTLWESGQSPQHLAGGRSASSSPTAENDDAAASPAPPPVPRKIIIHDALCPGDIAVLTAAVRELHEQYPGHFLTDIRTAHPALWESNPNVTRIADDDPDARHIGTHYDAEKRFGSRYVYATVNQSSQRPVHMLEAYCEGLAAALGLPHLRPHAWLSPSITLSDSEKGWASQVQERTGKPTRFWIVNAGSKWDYTAKLWPYYQEVIDRTKDRIFWAQVGLPEHQHKPLDGALNLIGKTDLRQLVRLIYHSSGVLCGVTALMHLAHWVERGLHVPFRRHAVVIAGGRESPHWFAYPGHQVFHTLGEIDCCAEGGCWKSRVEPLRNSPEMNDSLCSHPADGFPLCMRMISPAVVSQTVLRLANEGTLAA